jgi:hypothetical protein
MAIEWASWIVPCLSGGVGVGVAWGIFKQKVENHADKIRYIEGKLEHQVGFPNCEKIREQCREAIKESVDLLRKDVNSNRELVIAELREIHKFMGRVNGQANKW